MHLRYSHRLKALLLGILLSVIGVQCASRTPSAPGAIPLPDRAVLASDASARELILRLGAALDTQTGFAITLHEQELTSYLRYQVPSSAIQEPTVWVTAEGLVVQAMLGTQKQHTVRARLVLYTQAGIPQIRVAGMQVDAHRMPRFLTFSIEEAANVALWDAWPPLRIRSIAFDERTLSMSVERP